MRDQVGGKLLDLEGDVMADPQDRALLADSLSHQVGAGAADVIEADLLRTVDRAPRSAEDMFKHR